MIEQLTFELEATTLSNPNFNIDLAQKDIVDREISVYVIEDIVSQKKYVGISADPLLRIASHLSGNGSAELFKEIQQRRSDFEYRVLESFIDNDFSPSNTQSIAYHVEALMIAFYDSIKSGYNTKYYINANFEDEYFWLNVLPDNFKKFYINSNKKTLNNNIQDYLPTKYIMRMSNLKSPWYDIKAKIVYRIKLQSMIDKKNPVYIYAKELCKINRSQITRFMNGMNGALSVARLAELIHKIEKHLDVAHRFDIKKELTDYINKESVS